MDAKGDFGRLVSSQPQITLSQYEYRVSRLPVRRHPRRRRRQKETTSNGSSDQVTPAAAQFSPEDAFAPEVGNTTAEVLTDELSNTTLTNQPETELFEHDEHLPLQHTISEQIQDEYHRLPSADTTHEYDSSSNLDYALNAAIAPMYFDDDDQALLRDANTCCDTDVTTASSGGEEDEQDPNGVSPISSQDDSWSRRSVKRKVLRTVDVNPTDGPTRKKSSKARKRSKRTLVSAAVSFGNELTMVPHGSVEGGCAHEDSYSSPDEDAIEDSQMHVRRPLRRISMPARTPTRTIAARTLRQRMAVLNSTLKNADHISKPTPLRRGGLSKHEKWIIDMGDGFNVAERKVTRSSLSINKSGTRRLAIATGLELAPAPEIFLRQSQACKENTGAQTLPVDEVGDIEEFEEIGRRAASLQDPIVRIAKMTEVMRKTNLSGNLGTNRQGITRRSQKHRKSKVGQYPTQSLELALNTNSVQTANPEVGTRSKQGLQGTFQPVLPKRTPSHRPRRFTSGDGFDLNECRPTTFDVQLSGPLIKSQAATVSSMNVFSCPGNLAAVGRLAEESDELIEEYDPPTPSHQSVSIGMLQIGRPRHLAITPMTAQAAYASPPATTGTARKISLWNQTPSKLILPAQISRAKHDNLAEQIIFADMDEVENATFRHPRSAAHSSPSHDRSRGNTQLDDSSMMLDDAELLWDSSTLPNNTATMRSVNIRGPNKPLIELTRTASHRAGTRSPEKNAVRRAASHLLTSKGPLRRPESISRPENPRLGIL